MTVSAIDARVNSQKGGQDTWLWKGPPESLLFLGHGRCRDISSPPVRGGFAGQSPEATVTVAIAFSSSFPQSRSASNMSVEEKGGVAGADHSELKIFDVKGGDEALHTIDPDGGAISEEEYAAVLKKIDWRLTPVLALVNMIQLVDKNVSQRHSNSRGDS
jgi:hypothetical protein